MAPKDQLFILIHLGEKYEYLRINGCTESRQLSYSSVGDEWYDIENWQVPSVPGDHLLLGNALTFMIYVIHRNLKISGLSIRKHRYDEIYKVTNFTNCDRIKRRRTGALPERQGYL